MSEPLYTWKATHRKKYPDGSTKEFQVTMTGKKPPKGVNATLLELPKPEASSPTDLAHGELP